MVIVIAAANPASMPSARLWVAPETNTPVNAEANIILSIARFISPAFLVIHAANAPKINGVDTRITENRNFTITHSYLYSKI